MLAKYRGGRPLVLIALLLGLLAGVRLLHAYSVLNCYHLYHERYIDLYDDVTHQWVGEFHGTSSIPGCTLK